MCRNELAWVEYSSDSSCLEQLTCCLKVTCRAGPPSIGCLQLPLSWPSLSCKFDVSSFKWQLVISFEVELQSTKNSRVLALACTEVSIFSIMYRSKLNTLVALLRNAVFSIHSLPHYPTWHIPHVNVLLSIHFSKAVLPVVYSLVRFI